MAAPMSAPAAGCADGIRGVQRLRHSRRANTSTRCPVKPTVTSGILAPRASFTTNLRTKRPSPFPANVRSRAQGVDAVLGGMGDVGISGENPFEVAQLVSDLYPGVSPDPGIAECFDEQALFGKEPAPPIAVTIAAVVAAEVVASPTRVRMNLTRILAVGKHTRHGNRVVLQTVRTARNTA